MEGRGGGKAQDVADQKKKGSSKNSFYDRCIYNHNPGANPTTFKFTATTPAL
jgi:hypothetical protein